MRARVWGCRGSLAAPGPDTVRYGGNTSCVEVRLDDGTLVVLDAGTGIRCLGLTLADYDGPIHLLLTHLHMDHLQGLGFFAPFFQPGAEVHIWGPPSPTHSLEDRIAIYMSPPLFPVALRTLACDLTFHDAEGEWKIGSTRVHAVPVAHQGPTIGYRIEDNGRSLAYIPDHEPSLGVPDLRLLEPAWVSGHAVADSVDVLFHDAQYFEHEYPAKVGWGHSSVDHVVAFGQLADVGRLVLFHHDPMHTDDELEVLLARAHELWGTRPNPPVLAYEGMEVDLGT